MSDTDFSPVAAEETLAIMDSDALPGAQAPDDLGLRPEDTLIVDVRGFEGPLDLLLTLARNQKVDITRVSILDLAEQYLEFIRTARNMRLELAADYLVMASWLAYLKSRLLLPVVEEDDEPSGEELAAALARRLKQLEAMRGVADALQKRNLMGRDVFARGMPEPMTSTRRSEYDAELIDLLKAYAHQRQSTVRRPVVIAERVVLDLKDAREILTRLVGSSAEWVPLHMLLGSYLDDGNRRISVMASSFAASLELAREGHMRLRQDEHFAPLMVRSGAEVG
jgi:segregation and condensation protein A